jgi:hypothetical protein
LIRVVFADFALYSGESSSGEGSDEQSLASKWQRARSRTTETRELPPPASQSGGERQRLGGGGWPVRDDLSNPAKHRRGGAIGFDLSTVRRAKKGQSHDNENKS